MQKDIENAKRHQTCSGFDRTLITSSDRLVLSLGGAATARVFTELRFTLLLMVLLRGAGPLIVCIFNSN